VQVVLPVWCADRCCAAPFAVEDQKKQRGVLRVLCMFAGMPYENTSREKERGS